MSTQTVLITGIAGLLAGALSMGAGEYVSVRSQRELLDASTPDPQAGAALPQLDVNANELALVYGARGMSEPDAAAYAAEVLGDHTLGLAGRSGASDKASDAHVAVGTGLGAALSISVSLPPVPSSPSFRISLACKALPRSSWPPFWSGSRYWLRVRQSAYCPVDRRCGGRCANC